MVQPCPRLPLFFAARRQFGLVVTNRRVLVFRRRRHGPQASDLVIGKRFNSFTLERIRSGLRLRKIVTRAPNGDRLVFELRRGQRELGDELVTRLGPLPRRERAEAT